MGKSVMRETVDFSSFHEDPSYEVPPGAWWAGSYAKTGAQTVLANGRPVMRIGDPYDTHNGYKHVLKCPAGSTSPGSDPPCFESVEDPDTGKISQLPVAPVPVKVPDHHTLVVAGEGSSTVFAEGRAVHLQGQNVTCGKGTGSIAVGGSPNVFVAE